MNPAVEEPAARRPKDADADRLISAVYKTRGLLYALASLAANPPDDKIVNEPDEAEAEGIKWLAMDLGQELHAASNEYIDTHPAT